MSPLARDDRSLVPLTELASSPMMGNVLDVHVADIVMVKEESGQIGVDSYSLDYHHYHENGFQSLYTTCSCNVNYTIYIPHTPFA